MLSKEALVAMGMTSEQADKVIAAQTEDMKGYVPRSRLDEETTKVQTLSTQLSDRDKDMKDLKSKADKGSELETQLTTLQGKYKADTEDLQTKLTQQKLDSALDSAIVTAKGRNPKAVKALLDAAKLKLKDDGTVEGLDLDALKKSDPYLFEIEQKKDEGGGYQGGSGGAGNADPKSLNEAVASFYSNK